MQFKHIIKPQEPGDVIRRGITPGSLKSTSQFSQKFTAAIYRAEDTSTLQTGALNLILYVYREIVLYTNVCFQPTAELVLMFLHNTSAKNCSHLQETTSAEDLYSLLRTLSNMSGKIFIHVNVIPKIYSVSH